MMDAIEAGLETIGRMQNTPVSDEQASRFRFPKCGLCGRRPELIETKGSWLNFRTGLIGQILPDVISVPRYEILPCCSARYTKVIEHETRSQKLRRLANELRTVDR